MPLLNSQFSEETFKLLQENRIETLDMGALGLTGLATLKYKAISLATLLDGRLASGSEDTTIRLWNVRSEDCEAVLSGHQGDVLSLAVLPDGRLASGSWDKTLRLWNASSGACESILSGHESYVYALAVLPDGRLASCALLVGGIKLWPIAPDRSLYSTLKDALSKNNTLKTIAWSGTESLFTYEQHAELKAFLARNQASKIPVPTLPFLSTVREEAAGGAGAAAVTSPSSDEVAKLKDEYEARGMP